MIFTDDYLLLENITNTYEDDVDYDLSEEELGTYKYKYDMVDYEEIDNDEFLDYCVELLEAELGDENVE